MRAKSKTSKIFKRDVKHCALVTAQGRKAAWKWHTGTTHTATVPVVEKRENKWFNRPKSPPGMRPNPNRPQIWYKAGGAAEAQWCGHPPLAWNRSIGGPLVRGCRCWCYRRRTTSSSHTTPLIAPVWFGRSFAQFALPAECSSLMHCAIPTHISHTLSFTLNFVMPTTCWP
jgi:hypothetical protein